MPATNARAIAKAQTLSVDSVIIDLEDAVQPDRRADARATVRTLGSHYDFGFREVLLRINALDTDQWLLDLDAYLASGLDGIVVPKVERLEDLERLMAALAPRLGDVKPTIVIMIETPVGVVNAVELCSVDFVDAVLVGTADLGAAMGIAETPGRHGLQYCLHQVVLAAKAAGTVVIDGVYMDVRDPVGLEQECVQGRSMGFDGKTLIHPGQLAITNRVFSPSDSAIQTATGLIAAWETAQQSGEAVCLYQNRLVEHLHVTQARELLYLADLVKSRDAAN